MNLLQFEARAIGRLTRDVETRTFGQDGKVAKFSLAINMRKRDANGQVKEEVIFQDCQAFNNGNNKMADTLEKFLGPGSNEGAGGKGRLLYVEGVDKIDTWVDKNDGTQRFKRIITVNQFLFLDSKNASNSGGNRQGGQNATAPGTSGSSTNERTVSMPGPSHEDEQIVQPAGVGSEEAAPF